MEEYADIGNSVHQVQQLMDRNAELDAEPLSSESDIRPDVRLDIRPYVALMSLSAFIRHTLTQRSRHGSALY